MAVQIRKLTAVNGKKAFARRAAAARAKKSKPRQTNPTLIPLGAINPNRGGGKTVAKKKARKKASNPHRPAHKAAKRPSKTNPHRRRRANNPQLAKMGVQIVKNGAYGLLGFFVAKQLPQAVLGPKNSGPMGYLANLVSAGIAGVIANQMGGSEAAVAAVTGGGLQLVNRVVQDHMSPFAKALQLSGLGDAMALGEVVPDDEAYMPYPVVWGAGGKPVIPRQIDVQRAIAAANAAAAARPATTMGHLSPAVRRMAA